MSFILYVCGMIYLITSFFRPENFTTALILFGLSHLCEEVKELKKKQNQRLNDN